METKSPFFVKDCVLAKIATGHQAETLLQFHAVLRFIPKESLYHHFWRPIMESSLAPGSYYNDFSHWAHYELHDDFLAERLTLVNPSEYVDLEKLRGDILAITEKRIKEKKNALAVTPFYFEKSKIVIFNTVFKIDEPKDMVKILPLISESSFFYHFIDARRRERLTNDFSIWLEEQGQEYLPLSNKLKEIDPYFISLIDLKNKILKTITEFFINTN